jgi:polysaccharide pyruvyl transferase WcaK-like protein
MRYSFLVFCAWLFPLLALSVRGLSADGSGPSILLRSSWQTINVGDIGHTPGVLALLEKHMPDAEVRLWPGDVSHGVRELLEARFPRLVVLDSRDKILEAFEECDFLLHGSGPYLVAPDSIEKWVQATGKPYGVFGITFPPDRAGEREVKLLSEAEFVFFRDTVSLEIARDKGVTCPIMEFGPDGAFGVDLRNDPKARQFLATHDLASGEFLCCIPRYRHTPQWVIPRKNVAIDEKKHEVNQQWKEHDHAPLREAITKVVRETSLKVLICPEDETQMALGKEMIFDKLPSDVLERVVWRQDFWLTDEALSVYVNSAGLFGNEMHSPIMCIGNGVPAIVCRWESQTSKGIMWRDIGLGDWLFDFDQENEVRAMPEAVLTMAKDSDKARLRAIDALGVVNHKFDRMMTVLKDCLQEGNIKK